MFRYPGGKSKLKKQIIDKLISMLNNNITFIEPFVGGGSIFYNLIQNKTFENLWINDKDLGIFCLWTSILKYPEQLKKLVNEFQPSVEKFDEFKTILTSKNFDFEIVEYGFMKLAIHQISYSGLGTKSGGPLGGRSKKNIAGTTAIKYPIDCRWSPDYICKNIDLLFVLLNKSSTKCSCLDFAKIINNTEKNALIYLDPPYYVKGNDLYQYGFSLNDHNRLAKLLQDTKHKWILSYDDCEEIRELYKWATVEELSATYSITGSRKKNELLIYV